MKPSKLAFVIAALAAVVYFYEVSNINGLLQQAGELQKKIDDYRGWKHQLAADALGFWYGFTFDLPGTIQNFRHEENSAGELQASADNLVNEYQDSVTYRNWAMVVCAIALVIGLVCRDEKKENIKLAILNKSGTG